MSDGRDALSQAPTLAYRSAAPASPPRPTCQKCGNTMLQGVVCSDFGGGAALRGVGVWIEGEIKRRWWSIRFPKGRRYEVITFRCPSCGFLESYSPPG